MVQHMNAYKVDYSLQNALKPNPPFCLKKNQTKPSPFSLACPYPHFNVPLSYSTLKQRFARYSAEGQNMLNKLKERFKNKKRYLHTNIEYLLHREMIDVPELSNQTGVPVATIFRMKRYDNNPTLSSIEPIAEFFDIDLHELLYKDIASNEYQAKNTHEEGTKYIPVIELASVKKWPTNMNAKVYIGMTGDIGEKSFGLKIDTTSFMPVFYDGTIAIVDPLIEPRDSDYVLCDINKENKPVLRQLFIDGKKHFFKPINPNYGDLEHIKEFKILGVIVKSIENYR